MRESILRYLSRQIAVSIRRSWMFYGPLIFCVVSFFIYSMIWLAAAARIEEAIHDQIARLSDHGIEFKSDGISVSGYPFFLRGRIDKVKFERSRIWLWSVYRIHLEVSPLNVKSIRLVVKGPQSLHLWRDDMTGSDAAISSPPILPSATPPPMKVPPFLAFSGSARSFVISLEEEDVRFELRDVAVGRGEEPSPVGVRITHILGNIIPAAAEHPSVTGHPSAASGQTAFSVVVSGLRQQLEGRTEAVTTTLGSRAEQLDAIPPAIKVPQFEVAGLLKHPTDSLRDSQIELSHLRLDLMQGGTRILSPDQSVVNTQVPPVTRISSRGHLHVDADGFPAGRIELSLKDAQALEKVFITHAILKRVNVGPQISLSSLLIKDDTTVIPILAEGGYIKIAGQDIIELPRLFASQKE